MFYTYTWTSPIIVVYVMIFSILESRENNLRELFLQTSSQIIFLFSLLHKILKFFNILKLSQGPKVVVDWLALPLHMYEVLDQAHTQRGGCQAAALNTIKF